jgi:hypothetical protein
MLFEHLFNHGREYVAEQPLVRRYELDHFCDHVVGIEPSTLIANEARR